MNHANSLGYFRGNSCQILGFIHWPLVSTLRGYSGVIQVNTLGYSVVNHVNSLGILRGISFFQVLFMSISWGCSRVIHVKSLTLFSVVHVGTLELLMVYSCQLLGVI